jgi:hypothetical protein
VVLAGAVLDTWCHEDARVQGGGITSAKLDGTIANSFGSGKSRRPEEQKAIDRCNGLAAAERSQNSASEPVQSCESSLFGVLGASLSNRPKLLRMMLELAADTVRAMPTYISLRPARQKDQIG